MHILTWQFHILSIFSVLYLIAFQSSSNHVQRARIPSTLQNIKKPVVRSSTHSGASNPVTRSQPANAGTSKSMQEVPDGYDPKLVEMINTAIVDRSPSVKWDDIGSTFSPFNFSFTSFRFILFSFEH